MKLPKIIITDIDGVWTDGGMYYDQTGNEWKRFHTYDSAGVMLAHQLNIPVAIVTGENTAIVTRRAEKLNIDYLFQGVRNKIKVIEELIDKLNIEWKEVAYIGDDINDVGVLQKAGFTAVPSQSPEYIKKYTNIITTKAGGEGAFREFVEGILQNAGALEKTIEKVLLNFN